MKTMIANVELIGRTLNCTFTSSLSGPVVVNAFNKSSVKREYLRDALLVLFKK